MTNKKPLHLHIEHFFRKRYCLVGVTALMLVAVGKSDGKLLGIVRDAYAQGYGVVSAYLHEETARSPLFYITARVPTHSST